MISKVAPRCVTTPEAPTAVGSDVRSSAPNGQLRTAASRRAEEEATARLVTHARSSI